MDFNKNFKIFTTIIFAFSFLVFSFPASAQKVLQCAPMKATVNNDLEVKNDLQVDHNATIANDATVNNDLRVNKDIYGASGAQRIYLGNNTSSPFITNNAGNGILFYSQGGQNFLWQSLTNPDPNAMILRSGGGLPNNNNYNLQVFGQVSPYQLHTQIIHLDSQGIGSGLNSNIIKLTNTAGSGNGAGMFIGDGDDNLLFSALQADGSPGTAMLALDTSNNNIGIQTVNPQITLAIGDDDTGLKWNLDGNFSLYTNNSERIKIDPAGDVSINNRLCLGGVCRPDWPAAIPETDPTVLASVKDGVAWGELSGIPADISDGDQVGLTAVAWGDVSAKPAICPIGQFVIDISAGTCAVPPAAAAEADTLATVTTRGNSTTNAIIVGGLTVDTNTLYVDSVNNRVGIGTLAPSYELDMGAANSRIRLQNPTAVLNSYITAGSSETSTGKNFAVAIKDSLWVTQNAFIDGDLTVQGNSTLGGAATDITNVNGDICIGFLCIRYIASKTIYCNSGGYCDDQSSLPGCSSPTTMPATMHVKKGDKEAITDYFCKWKGGAVTGYSYCGKGGSDASYSDYECRYFEVQ